MPETRAGKSGFKQLLAFVSSAFFLTACAHSGHAGEEAEGRFSITQNEDGKFWFVDNNTGTEFLSMGVNHVVEAHDFEAPAGTTYYDPVPTIFEGDQEAWSQSTADILSTGNFNTYGAWSSPEANNGDHYDTPILYVADHAQERVLAGLEDDFEDQVRTNLLELIDLYGPFEHEDKVIGVFLDNEMAWYGRSPWDNNPRYTILEQALTEGALPSARASVIRFLQDRYPTPSDFSAAWEIPPNSWADLDGNDLIKSGTDTAMKDRADLLELAADSFYRRSTAVVRDMVPGVLILGTRFAGDAPDAVIEACGRYCDVVSFNHYQARPEPDPRLVTRYWLLGKKPLMITEYSWRAQENTTGNPNTGGAGSVVQTQAERGANYSAYVSEAVQYPMIVGLHWFEFSDQSPQGRFDGENSNYGIVDINHNIYEDVLSEMAKTNTIVNELHASSTRPIPNRMPDPPKATVIINQYPNRPASIDLIAVKQALDPNLFNAEDASIEMSPADQGFQLTINTGTVWGCGTNIFGPADWSIPGPEGTTNLDGYSSIHLDIEVSQPIQMQMILDEAGVDNPNASEYDMSAGDDGESYAYEKVALKKGMNNLKFNLSDVSPRGVWGNQLGKRRVDVQALRGIGLVFPPGPSPTEVHVKSLRLHK